MTSLIPTRAAAHIEDGLSEYLTTSIALTDNTTAQQLSEFLLNPDGGMFRGPYVRTRLPYAPATEWEGVLSWLPSWFTPYRHQAEAFKRLSTLGPDGPRRPEPTLVVTGTGSGKTESFLFPVLDHCMRNPGGGIKALILYPMNALASDQEQRLARLLSDNPELGGITAGLYTGEVPAGGRSKVSEKGLITSREVMRDTPPDILLTNYKMLDQLLLREADRPLWEKSAQTLQYLVLDEFHSYDAAQGTDVAMLLRRLGLMLRAHQSEGFLSEEEQVRPLGRVTPVATSATLGGGEGTGGASAMVDFAYTVFGEKIGPEAIVGETLLTVGQWQETIPELVGAPLAPATPIPGVDEVEVIVDKLAAAVDAGRDYAEVVHEIACAELFRCAPDTESAIAAMATNEVVVCILREAATALPLEHSENMPGRGEEIASLVQRIFPEPATRRNLGHKAAEFLAFVLSEIAHLRSEFGAARGWDGKKIPGVETHLWVREISRIDRLVGAGDGAEQIFRWSDNGASSNNQAQLDAEGQRRWLPAIYCRHCGRSGWMTQMTPGEDMIETAVQKVRFGAFRDPKRQRPLIDATSEEAAGVQRSADGSSAVKWLNMDMAVLNASAPGDEERETGAVVPVLTYAGDNVEERAAEEYCPSCGESDAIRYLGSSVATLLSVALSNLFGTDELDNAEKKTLVFADSVQDAAHRAGFIQNRSRAFALRARIHRAVMELAGTSSETTLDQLADVIIAQARNEGSAAEQSRALYELLPPDMAHAPQFRGAWESGAPKREQHRAMQAVKKRLDLDIALQFGEQVDLPRSLVSTGTLTVSVGATDDVLLTAARNVGVVADDDELLAWARGVVEKMRIEGGITHPWLKQYLKNDCNPYLLNRREARARGIPAFARYTTPKFPRSGAALKGAKGKSKNNATMSVGAQQGWYARWTAQALGGPAGSAFTAASLVTSLFNELEIAGMVGSVPTTTAGRVYFLEPETVVIRKETEPELLECAVCHMRVGVDALARDALEGATCFALDCTGTFDVISVEENYYNGLYQSANSRTVVASEHTGLVPTAKRKQVENQFKAPASAQEADSPNVLVATPTLEMGIDIGDLSTVMLASMPSSVASYVQRVGRAGRLSGNSLVVALVRGRGRALTKLEHPLETIAGSVTAPAAYLSARDIMHRQFIAYLFDAHSIGQQVESLAHAYDLFRDRAHTALDVLVDIVRGGIDEELDRFCAALTPHAGADVLKELRSWATDPNGLIADIGSARTRWNRTHYELLERLSVLETRERELSIRTSSAPADDDLTHEYQVTRASLRFTQKQLNAHKDEYWISALERYGLLPNFTLLDEAVEFHLSVSTYNDVVQEFETEALQYSRGISTALTELAPGNTFYVQGVAATIDSVDLGSEQSALTHWRVCPACSFSTEVADDAVAGACPNCGAPGYADRAQLIAVVEMNKVSATVDRSRSTISDFDDDRRSARFQTLLSYNVPDGGRGPAWYLQRSGFGMEYLPHVEMHWLNLGKFGSGNKLMASSQEVEAPLFRVCEHCGHLDKEAGANHWSDHHPWCKHRNDAEEHSITFALGRTLGTQGVLVHLPSRLSVMESSTLPSLLAALKLGFREYLGGNPDHLDIEVVSEVSDGRVSDMLLIHDKVPGGTGYLAQFTNPAEIRAMFEVAYTRLVKCNCAREERSACPSCLLPLVPESQIPLVSREAAAAALGKILADDIHLPSDANPLEFTWEGRVTTEQPESSDQSKLEERFIEQFRADLKSVGAQVTETVDNNRAHWTIRFPNSPHIWVLREQVELGTTTPDVLLQTQDNDVRDIAIYLDGEAFHARGKNQRVADDFAKRNSLYERGYLPWSMTWRDIDHRQDTVRNQETPPPAWFNSAIESSIAEHLNVSRASMQWVKSDPMSQLLAMLPAPTQKWGSLSDAAFTSAIYGGELSNGLLTRTHLNAVKVSYGAATRHHYGVDLSLEEREVDRDAWQAFLGLSNLAYLNDTSARVTVTDIAHPQLSVVAPEPAHQPANVPSSLAGAWARIYEEFADDPEVLNATSALRDAGASAPDAESVGQEIDGLGIIARWPKEGVLIVYEGDGEEFDAISDTVIEANFGPDPGSIPTVVRDALHLS
ncbi:DEAD/DEAH box helicase [Corynebacterium sanguinis]|uniref:DEAD/DEAH box helicase n=2 Tax=Bacteria TaxID=2 RepID=UPI0021A8CBBF|nr:DEAD/DEAH box helicase [Corynebacterium sanguinis]MCT1463183.1 DEAD/DEAH box helicase [Corynebacterium sanguinis]MCT2329882.1 DEAD/DEAH box helicase [Corynebacterium sanguinis]